MKTTDLSRFGTIELIKLSKTLKAMAEFGLPDDFYNEDVKPILFTGFGNVFLTNCNDELCGESEGRLYVWHHCEHCGHEGYEGDCDLQENGCNECLNTMEM